MRESTESEVMLVRRSDAARCAELVNDSIKAKGKFAAAILMMPPYPAPDCPICGYAIDNQGLCVLDAAHTAPSETGSQCYWCKHPDHGDKVCPVPHLAIGENGLSGSYPCGCTQSTVIASHAWPFDVDAPKATSDAFGEAEMLLRSWLACMQEPRRKDWEEIAANLMTDSQRFLDEKGRMVKAETEGQRR